VTSSPFYRRPPVKPSRFKDSGKNQTDRRIAWIERILDEGLYQNRIWTMLWVLGPYLVHEDYRNLDFNNSFNLLQIFLYSSSKLRPLNPIYGDSIYHDVIEFALKKAIEVGRPAMRLSKIVDKRTTLFEELRSRGIIKRVIQPSPLVTMSSLRSKLGSSMVLSSVVVVLELNSGLSMTLC
jgi:hypothetical protein